MKTSFFPLTLVDVDEHYIQVKQELKREQGSTSESWKKCISSALFNAFQSQAHWSKYESLDQSCKSTSLWLVLSMTVPWASMNSHHVSSQQFRNCKFKWQRVPNYGAISYWLLVVDSNWWNASCISVYHSLSLGAFNLHSGHDTTMHRD